MEHVQTDTKGKGKAEEGSGKGEELADSIGSLSIGPGRTNFKKNPVIIIVIGMAGASISLARCLITFSSMNLQKPTWELTVLFCPLVQGRGRRP